MFRKLLLRTSSNCSRRRLSPSLFNSSCPRCSVWHLLLEKDCTRNSCLHFPSNFSFSYHKRTPFYGERPLSTSLSSKENGRVDIDHHEEIQNLAQPGSMEMEGGREDSLPRVERGREDSVPSVERGREDSRARVQGGEYPILTKEEGKESLSKITGDGNAECCPRSEGEEAEPLSKSEGEEELLSSLEADDDTSLTSNIEDDDEEETDIKSDLDEADEDEVEAGEDDGVDLTNVADDLKEMLQDGYVIESIEEDGFPNGATELLTIEEIREVLEEVRARDVQMFSVSDRCEWTDTMVVATGLSDRHVRGIAEALVFKIKKKGQVESPLYPTIEGQIGGKWLVVDCGNIIIHIFDEESRGYYRLEDIWTGAVKASTADEDLHTMLKKAGFKDPNY